MKENNIAVPVAPENSDKTNYSKIFFNAKEMEKKFPLFINKGEWKRVETIAFSILDKGLWEGESYQFYRAKCRAAVEGQNSKEVLVLSEMLKAFVKKSKASEDEKLKTLKNVWESAK